MPQRSMDTVKELLWVPARHMMPSQSSDGVQSVGSPVTLLMTKLMYCEMFLSFAQVSEKTARFGTMIKPQPVRHSRNKAS